MRPSTAPATRCEPTRRPSDDPEGFAPVVWVPDGDAGDVVRVEGPTPVQVHGTAAAGGLRFELALPSDATAIVLEQGGVAVRRWTIEPAAAEPALVTAARNATVAERAQTIAALARAMPSLGADDRATALDLVADLRLREAEVAVSEARTQAFRDALASTRDAHAFAMHRGDRWRARCHAGRGSFVALERLGDADELEHWTDALGAPDREPEPSTAIAAYARGLVAQRVGDLQAAAEELRVAVQAADAFADHKLVAASAQQLADVLARLGQDDELATVLARADAAAAELDCRQWLHTENNTSWARAQLREHGAVADDPVPALANALAVLELADDPDDDCHDPRLAAHVRLTLALVAADEGAVGWAAELARSLAHTDDAEIAGWLPELQRRIALATGDRGALVEWLTALQGEAPMDAEARWSSAWGRGQVLEAIGAKDDALLAYDAAERALASMMTAIDFDAGRDRLLLGRQRSAGRSVALQVERGDPRRALCTARVARLRTSRVLDRSARIGALSPEARRDWTAMLARHAELGRELEALRAERWALPVDRRAEHDERMRARATAALATSRTAIETLAEGSAQDDPCTRMGEAGELALAYFPSGDGREWFAFAFDDAEVTVHRIAQLPALADDLQAWSDALLEPVRARIDGAQALRILPTGVLWNVPFAALPWQGDVLLARAPVVLALDLVPNAARDEAAARHALVVADPRGDLPAAAGEGEVVAAALRVAGWSTTVLRGAEARSDAIQHELARADLVHYAGHGRHAGLEGWQSALELADAAKIGVVDLLALPRVPAEVVLPACDTAPSDVRTLGGDMNIARAFLLAGADAVVASRGAIDDRLAAAVATRLYAQPPFHAGTTAARLREALLHARSDASLPAEVRAQWHRVVAIVR